MLGKFLSATVILAWGNVAQAAVVDVVITGTLGDSNTFNIGTAYDTYDNVWNGALVHGAAFTARYVYDTSLGQRGDMVNSVPGDILGGYDADTPPSAASASLTIGGTTVNFASPAGQTDDRDNSTVFVAPGYFPSPLAFPDYGFDWARYVVNVESYSGDFSYGIFGQLYFDINAILGTIPANLETGYSFAANPYDIFMPFALPTIFGYASFYEYNRSTNEYPTQSYVQLYGEQITVSVRGGDTGGGDPTPAPVPLPASFPLLLAGLAGFAGWKARSRCKAA